MIIAEHDFRNKTEVQIKLFSIYGGRKTIRKDIEIEFRQGETQRFYTILSVEGAEKLRDYLTKTIDECKAFNNCTTTENKGG